MLASHAPDALHRRVIHHARIPRHLDVHALGLARGMQDRVDVLERLDPIGACRGVAAGTVPSVTEVRSLADASGGDVARVLNRGNGATWTVERLRRTVRRLVAEGMVEPNLLGRASSQTVDNRLVQLVAGIKAAAPDTTGVAILVPLNRKYSAGPGFLDVV